MTILNTDHDRATCSRWFCSSAIVLLAWVLVAPTSAAPNQSLQLDGQDSYAELPPDLFKGLTHTTVEVWAKWDSFAYYSRIFEFGESWHSMSMFNHENANDLRFNFYPVYAKGEPSRMHRIHVEDVLRTNEWMHLAAVSGPGGMELYVNGRLAGQHTNAASLGDLNGAETSYLGRSMSGNATDRTFEGEIDELRVWGQRRTAAQIREAMFKRLSGNESGLVHLWNFDDGTVHDAGPLHAHGKLMGTARVGATDLGLVVEPAPTLATAEPFVPAPVSAGVHSAVWWIAGALSALVLVLAWLAFLFRRSGLGTDRLVGVSTSLAVEAQHADDPPAELKERALAELTTFAKESLVQGLYSQRETLLATQKQAHEELVKLEARLTSLDLPERIQAYESRIAELEHQLETRNGEFQELTRATLDLLRQRLASEQRDHQSRFN